MSESRTPKDIAVIICTDKNIKNAKGSGFFTKKTEIATCYHVLLDKNGDIKNNSGVSHMDPMNGSKLRQ